MTSSIRVATGDDLDDLTALGMSVQDLHADARPDIFAPTDAGALRTFFRDRLEDDSIVLIAMSSEGAIGYLLAEHLVRPATPFKVASSIVYVHHIGVDKGHRRERAGRELMAACRQCAAELGATAIRLDSWAFNTDAHRFFEASGFSPVNVVFERAV